LAAGFVISKTTPEFWKRYQALPSEVQRLANRGFRIWLANPHHPSIRFKKIQGTLYSARVGAHYRAIGHLQGERMTWVWIGSHEEYDALL
jgi:hypothetical protein